MLSIYCVCCKFMGTSQNVRTGVWLAHKCVPTTNMTWGNFILFNSEIFEKQTKVLEKGNKMKETKQHLHLIYLFYPPYLDLVPRVGGSVELLVPGSLCKAFDL